MQEALRQDHPPDEAPATRVLPGDPLSRALREAVLLCGGPDGPDGAAARLEELAARLNARRFHLAVLGQFKRGKSTLLNALLGEEVLPTSLLPLTAIPTFIREGTVRGARVEFQSGREPAATTTESAAELCEFLAGYVTEEKNPGNRLGVSLVEVSHPAPLLSHGVVLIDTPGIGSTHRHNTEATLNFLPRCDAALFVVSPDPPLTEVEVEFLKRVRSRVGRVFFVLNKADYLNEAEREEMLGFVKRVLTEQAGLDGDLRLLTVSARQGLEAFRTGDAALRESSGMRELESCLQDFLVREKESALRRAVAGRAVEILEEVLLEQRLSLQALRLPLEEIERRLGLLEERLGEVRMRQVGVRDGLEGDRKRLAALLEEQAGQLRKKAFQLFMRTVERAIEESGAAPDAPQEALAEVIPAFFENELGNLSVEFESRVRQTLDARRREVDALVEAVRQTAAELFDLPHQAAAGAGEFEVSREPYWVTHYWPVTLGLLPEGFWDRFLPAGVRRKRLLRRMRERVEVLVAENVENVRWPTLQNLDRSIREFGEELDRRLEEAVRATIGAIEAARERRLDTTLRFSGEEAAREGAIERLERLVAQLQAEAAR